MPTTARAEPGHSFRLRTQSKSPPGVGETHHLTHHLTPLRVCTGRKLESGVEWELEPTYSNIECSLSTTGVFDLYV